MTAAILLGLAAWVLVPVPGRSALGRISDGPRPAVARRPLVLVIVGVLTGLGVLAVLAGPIGVLLGMAALLPVGTSARVVLLRLGQRRRERDRVEVARACAIVAAQLRAGQMPTSAVRTAAQECPVLAEAAGSLAVGADVVDLWHRQAARPGREGLAQVARAWSLSTRTGAAMAPALTAVAAALRSDREVRRTVGSELAAPVMTSRLLAGLPLLALALGYSMGGNPLAFLTGSVIGGACLFVGLALACAGVLWTERIAAKAS